MEHTRRETQPEAKPSCTISETWIEKLGRCCDRRSNTVESVYPPERVGQALADLGPPTRSSLHLPRTSGNHDVDIDRLVPITVRKSISYPDFSAESIVESDGESHKSSPVRGESGFQRLHGGLLKRLSKGSSAAGSVSPAGPRRGHQVNMSQESINRRKELRRALHKRVTEELLEERGTSSEYNISESEVPLVRSSQTDEADTTARHKTGDSLKSKKSSRSIAAGLPTVTEVEDSKAVLGNSEEDRKSTGKSSWVTDLPSSGWATRKPSQLALNSNSAVRPPSEPIPELPESFLKSERDRDSAQTEPPNMGQSKTVTEPSRSDESHAKRLSMSTRDAIREVFKPLEDSPKRLGLWLRGSTSNFGSRPSSYKSSQILDRGSDGQATPGHSKLKESSVATKGTQIHHAPMASFDGHTDIIFLDRVQPKNDICIDTEVGDKENPDPNRAPVSSMRRLIKSVLESPFVLIVRKENKEHSLTPKVSLPSLRNGRTQQRNNLILSPASNHTCCTLPAAFTSSSGLWGETLATKGEKPPTPIRACDDPFLDLGATSANIPASTEVLCVDKRSRHQYSSSLQSSTASFRAREILAVSKRIVSDPKKKPQRENSKFIEDLDDGKALKEDLDRGSLRLPLENRPAPVLLPQLDGPDDLQVPAPLQRSRSYTVADFMQSQNTAGRVWERALQEHAHEIAHRNNESRKGSGKSVRLPLSKSRSGRPSFRSSGKGKEPARDEASSRRRRSMLDEDISPGASPTQTPDRASSPTRSHVADPAQEVSVIASPCSEEDSVICPGMILGNADVPDSWARFPSHTREIRNAAAGANDLVNTYDFAGDELDEPAISHEQRHENTRVMEIMQRNSSFQPAQSPVVRLPTGILQIAAKFSKAASMELAIRRSIHRGIRSSISAGGQVKAPELELLGLTTPVYRPMSALAAAEAPDLDRPPPSPRMGGRKVGETDETGRQLSLPMDWTFGRRPSSTFRRFSRSDSHSGGAGSELRGPKDEPHSRRVSTARPFLTPPTIEDIPVLQRPPIARLASAMLSVNQPGDDATMNRRRSKSHNGVLSDHGIGMRELHTWPKIQAGEEQEHREV